MIAAVRFFTSLRLTVVCLTVLMILVFWGTLYQVDSGLWQAKEVFFYSWFVRVSGIPVFPGGALVMGLLFVNLLAATIFRMELTRRTLGILFIHLGLLLMLAGGWVTHQFGEESFLSLAEGEGSNLSSSYRDWELACWAGDSYPLQVTAYDSKDFRPGLSLDVGDPDLSVTVELYMPHGRAFQAPGNSGVEISVINASGIVTLEAVKPGPKPEEHMPGTVLRVRRGDREDSVLLFGGDVGPTRLPGDGPPVFMSLRRKRFPLPVSVTLHDFTKAYHPGSGIAKSFSSLIEVDNQGMQRDVLIEMNEPFRFKEYTFYQASFADLEGGAELSTFAVTRNYGRLLPYVATGLTVFGLCVHFLFELYWRSGSRKKTGAIAG